MCGSKVTPLGGSPRWTNFIFLNICSFHFMDYFVKYLLMKHRALFWLHSLFSQRTKKYTCVHDFLFFLIFILINCENLFSMQYIKRCSLMINKGKRVFPATRKTIWTYYSSFIWALCDLVRTEFEPCICNRNTGKMYHCATVACLIH